MFVNKIRGKKYVEIFENILWEFLNWEKKMLTSHQMVF
jgi:hypothetical protein